ncbi:MAG: 6-carboxytetrahydropterin synthase [Bdellovibrionaceae bacterium]|nr:6-carboxytetrahydropterin synthase [Pseudobdellovibrionaceae bacterium]
MKFELKQHFQIESSRYLPHLEKSHPCSRMHGHSFKIILTLVGEADPRLAWVIDYNDIQLKMKPILERIDHRTLNEVPGLENPTSEMLTKWVYDETMKVLPQVTRVTIAETPFTECAYPV